MPATDAKGFALAAASGPVPRDLPQTAVAADRLAMEQALRLLASQATSPPERAYEHLQCISPSTKVVHDLGYKQDTNPSTEVVDDLGNVQNTTIHRDCEAAVQEFHLG